MDQDPCDIHPAPVLGSPAGLYYHYGIPKHVLEKKKFGVYEHHVQNRKVPLVRGFDDYFMAPHSRHTEVRTEDIETCEDLIVLAKSDEAGVLLCMSRDGSRIFMMGHPEYDRVTWIGNTSGIRRRAWISIFRSTIIRETTRRRNRCCSGEATEISSTPTG